MGPEAPELLTRPEARTLQVDELVEHVLRGEVRIPVFQRGLRWGPDNVIELFDSIYRGYPIGSLLLRRGRADAARVAIGPLVLQAPEVTSAFWVVDGQQRITALAAGLGRPEPTPRTPDDNYVVYFDPSEQRFALPPKTGEIPSAWVPVPRLLDATLLSEWVLGWVHAKDTRLVRIVFEAGKRLRQYSIPSYVVDTEDEELLRRIFFRVNKSGKELEWTDVHEALFGRRQVVPSSLSELADALETLGMGRPDQDTLLTCLLAHEGLDVTRNLGEHLARAPHALDGVAGTALPVLRSVMSFLRDQARIVHLDLLPYSTPLLALTRLFRIHPEPRPRTQELLVRWVWRSMLAGAKVDDRTLRRRAISAVGNDEEESVQQMLTLVPAERPATYRLAPNFDARSAASRIAMIGLSSLRPRNLGDGAIIDVATLVEDRGSDAFRYIVTSQGGDTRSPGNRIVHPGSGIARREVETRIDMDGVDSAILRSHAISPEAARALRNGDVSAFLEKRIQSLSAVVSDLGERLAGWSRTDRPSIEYLLRRAEG